MEERGCACAAEVHGWHTWRDVGCQGGRSRPVADQPMNRVTSSHHRTCTAGVWGGVSELIIYPRGLRWDSRRNLWARQNKSADLPGGWPSLMPRLEVATHGRRKAEASGCVAFGGTCRDLTRSAILLRHTMRCAAILAKKFPALRPETSAHSPSSTPRQRQIKRMCGDLQPGHEPRPAPRGIPP